MGTAGWRRTGLTSGLPLCAQWSTAGTRHRCWPRNRADGAHDENGHDDRRPGHPDQHLAHRHIVAQRSSPSRSASSGGTLSLDELPLPSHGAMNWETPFPRRWRGLLELLLLTSELYPDPVLPALSLLPHTVRTARPRRLRCWRRETQTLCSSTRATTCRPGEACAAC